MRKLKTILSLCLVAAILCVCKLAEQLGIVMIQIYPNG